ncbi:hypothetical protein L207DRAFT_94453 [Hyaloscypha variabilis F]|uniref:Uncharacterized protein n=1 Tax=Hyaloscypha variabilis (strain UAMH 11265 / GT02V1 / F) TaxID=1149755 RepID=A0A2J6RB88_HYAVF|nr:hypothetical protein L207DRAFT_94453 [Hyaloscypha variabilis F]
MLSIWASLSVCSAGRIPIPNEWEKLHRTLANQASARFSACLQTGFMRLRGSTLMRRWAFTRTNTKPCHLRVWGVDGMSSKSRPSRPNCSLLPETFWREKDIFRRSHECTTPILLSSVINLFPSEVYTLKLTRTLINRSDPGIMVQPLFLSSK